MAQFARPSNTIANGGWAAVGASTHHEATDEVTPNGATDYAEAGSGDTQLEMGLSAVTDPTVHTGHVLRFTAFSTGGGPPEKLDVFLAESGASLFQAFNGIAIDRISYTEYVYGLTEANAALITDYSALEIWIAVDTLGAEEIRVTQAELEAPDAAGNLYYETLPATEVSDPVVAKGASLYRALAASSLGAAVLSKAGLFCRALTTTLIGVNTMRRKITRGVAATAISVASLASAKVFLKVLSAVAGSTVSLGRGILKSLAATTTGLAVIGYAKDLQRALVAIATSGLVVDTKQTISRVLVATATGLTTLARDIGGGLIQKTLDAAAVITPSLSRAGLYAKQLIADAVSIAQFIADKLGEIHKHAKAPVRSFFIKARGRTSRRGF